MSKDNIKRLVPKLRFPEFEVDGIWTEMQLGPNLSKHPQYGINAPAVPFSNNLPRYLRITDISEDGRIIQHQAASVAMDVVEENYLEEGDIVLARTGASVGKAYKYNPQDGKLVFAGFLIRIKPDEKKLDSRFLFQFLFSRHYWRWVEFVSARSGQPGINGNEFASMPILLPPTVREQLKIADCLSSLDDLITAEALNLEALKTHKKGLLQNLFPAEGETVPRLRFPEFQGSGEWMVDDLGKFLAQHPDYGINAAAVPFSSELPAYIRITDISEEGTFLRNQMVSVAQKVTNENYLREGDIVVARTGASVGKAYKYRVEDGELVFAGFLIRLRPDKSKLDSELLYQFLCTSQFWKWVKFISARSGQPGINGNEYAAMPIPIPPSTKEQYRVSASLASIDKLITVHRQRLETLKIQKEGLMQQLFPSTLENTSQNTDHYGNT